MQKNWIFNTSNPGKLNEFKILLAKQGITLDSTSIDLKEIDSDPVSVVVHKACQVNEGVLVEDTSLDVDGAEVGVQVRWMFENLKMLCGRKALWRVLLAYRKDEFVYVFEGKTEGKIVPPSGTGGYGFDSVFLPDGATHTLAHAKPEALDARAKVVKKFMSHEPLAVLEPITKWDGPWQVVEPSLI
jgi:XTP/dITP diphosphohydrolase